MSAAAPWKKGQKDNDTPTSPAPAEDDGEMAPIPESLALTIPGNPEDSAVAVINTNIYGTDESMFDMSDVRIPKLRLANGLSQEVQRSEARSGQWVLMGNDPADSAEIVILSMAKKRELRDKETQDVLCSSDDAKIGHGNPGGICEQCPMAQWGPKNPKTGKATAIPCTFIYSYQAYSLTHHQLCVVDFRKTGLDAAKQINTHLMQRKFRNFVVRLGNATKQGGPTNATYYIPTVNVRTLSEEEREEVAEGTPF